VLRVVVWAAAHALDGILRWQGKTPPKPWRSERQQSWRRAAPVHSPARSTVLGMAASAQSLIERIVSVDFHIEAADPDKMTFEQALEAAEFSMLLEPGESSEIVGVRKPDTDVHRFLLDALEEIAGRCKDPERVAAAALAYAADAAFTTDGSLA
jgi:hypothetical protein